jgi:hypothetical protein
VKGLFKPIVERKIAQIRGIPCIFPDDQPIAEGAVPEQEMNAPHPRPTGTDKLKGNYHPVDSLPHDRYSGRDRPEFKGLG